MTSVRLRRVVRDPEYRFGAVLFLLLATFVFLASGPTGRWVPPVTVVAEGLTLLMVLAAAGVRRGTFRLALVVTTLGLVVAALGGVVGGSSFRGAVFATSSLLVLLSPVAIVHALVRRRKVDVQTILGALCIYVLLGMLCAYVDLVLQASSSRPFFAQTGRGSTADVLYFSFVTLTTVGYGDLTAATSTGRAIAVLEAMSGQLYLVTVVALLVGQFRPSRGTSDRTGGAEAPPVGPDQPGRPGAVGRPPDEPGVFDRS